VRNFRVFPESIDVADISHLSNPFLGIPEPILTYDASRCDGSKTNIPGKAACRLVREATSS
jgi:hypothetical protein